MRDVLTGAVVDVVRRPTGTGAPANVEILVDGKPVATVTATELLAAVRESS